MVANEVKDRYYITKDRQNGTRECVEEIIGTEQEAREKFHEIIRAQQQEYHVLKILPRWRIIRLFDSENNQIAQES